VYSHQGQTNKKKVFNIDIREKKPAVVALGGVFGNNMM